MNTIPWGEISPDGPKIHIKLMKGKMISIQRTGDILFLDITTAKNEHESKRFIVGQDKTVYLEPALPELPMVIKPIDELSIVPGKKLEVFIEIPLLISIRFGIPGKGITLWETPVTELSQSFFGNPDSGELAYSIVSTLSKTVEQSELININAFCPIVITNKSEQMLNFERMILRVPFLTLYYGADYIYTSPVTISFKGSEQTSQVTIKKKPPEETPPMRIASFPRKKEEKSVLKKSFFFLKTLYMDN